MKKAIFGFGGFAREVLSYLEEPVKIFVDDAYCEKEAEPISSFDPQKYQLLICVGDPALRKQIVSGLPKETKFFSFVHPTAVVGKDVEIGEGSIICPQVVVTTNVTLGKHNILNLCSTVGHDSIIGDYYTSSPGGKCSGSVSLGEKVYLGTNASIREGIRVCGDVTIGMNAAVVKNIYDAGIYAGVPAKKIR